LEGLAGSWIWLEGLTGGSDLGSDLRVHFGGQVWDLLAHWVFEALGIRYIHILVMLYKHYLSDYGEIISRHRIQGTVVIWALDRLIGALGPGRG